MAKFKMKVPKITRSNVHDMESAQGQMPLAVQRPVCPLCGDRAADTKVSLGPVSVEICRECSEPLWNAVGLAGWAKKFFK